MPAAGNKNGEDEESRISPHLCENNSTASPAKPDSSGKVDREVSPMPNLQLRLSHLWGTREISLAKDLLEKTIEDDEEIA